MYNTRIPAVVQVILSAWARNKLKTRKYDTNVW